MFVDTMGVRATDFEIDEGMQDLLLDSGMRAATEFLRGWDFDRYVAEFRSGAVADVRDLADAGVASGPGPWDLEDFDLDAYEAPPPELEDEEPAETRG